jgi:hypothetical protein
VFGFLVAIVSTLLMAPQAEEFGTKVALLGGLVLVCAARPLIERWTPAPGSAADDVGLLATGFVTGRRTGSSLVGGAVRVGLVAVAIVVLASGIVAAGSPARGFVGPDATEVLGRVPHDVDPATFPSITVQQDVADWNHEIAGPGVRELVLTLAENLELERQALLRSDPAILEAVDHGDRLEEMRSRLDEAEATGTTAVERYQIDDVNVRLLVPFGRQDGLSLGLDSTGTVTTETYDAGGQLQTRETSPFAEMFVLRRATGGRWLNVAVLPPPADG